MTNALLAAAAVTWLGVAAATFRLEGNGRLYGVLLLGLLPAAGLAAVVRGYGAAAVLGGAKVVAIVALVEWVSICLTVYAIVAMDASRLTSYERGILTLVACLLGLVPGLGYLLFLFVIWPSLDVGRALHFARFLTVVVVLPVAAVPVALATLTTATGRDVVQTVAAVAAVGIAWATMREPRARTTRS